MRLGTQLGAVIVSIVGSAASTALAQQPSTFAVYAQGLNAPRGLAFGPDGTLFVGDRSGTVFRIRSNGQATMIATLPASVAAFHLAMGPDRCLYVTAPTLTSRDSVYRVHLDGEVEVVWSGFGRPQGLAFGPDGLLYVVEALAGASGLYRLPPGRDPDLMVSGEGFVGLAFTPSGEVIVASNDTAWRLHL